MNAHDLWAARYFAKIYRVGLWQLPKTWHHSVYAHVRKLSATAPEVWLSLVMQLAKGNK